MADGDSYARVRADFNALKVKLKASVDQLDPERYDAITERVVSLDEATIRQQIEQRRGSFRVEKMMTDIERRLSTAEELQRGRT